MKRSYKNTIISVLGILGVAQITSGLINPVSAVNSGTINFSAEILPSTTVTIPTEPIELSLTPSGSGTFGSTDFNVVVSTNQPGYTLSMNTSSTTLTSSTIDPNTNDFFTIPTLDHTEEGYTESNFTRNRWGIAVDSGNFNAVAASNTIKDTNTSANADVTNIRLGTNLDLLTAAGEYQTTIDFMVVTKILIKSINDLTYMQDFADLPADILTRVKNNMVENASYELKDSRDNKTYNITKIGNVIWMTSNLNIAGGITLNPTTSNVANSYTLPVSSMAGFDNDTKASVYNDSTYGGYYSWKAATAGTNPSSGETASDICPKGWKLPSRDNISSLIAVYPNGAALTAAPWYGQYGGSHFNGGDYDSGAWGQYWSSTAHVTTAAYALRFDNANGISTDSATKGIGYSVRCVAK